MYDIIYSGWEKELSKSNTPIGLKRSITDDCSLIIDTGLWLGAGDLGKRRVVSA
jgi:hypothetical protein